MDGGQKKKPGRKAAGKGAKNSLAALNKFGEIKNPRPEKKPRERKKENAGVWRRALNSSEEECFV